MLWLLMPDDGRSDGEFRRYLAQPARWRHFDVELFDHLSRLIDTNATRSVDHAADWDLFPAARFFAEVVPVGRHARRFLLGLAKTEETQRYATSR